MTDRETLRAAVDRMNAPDPILARARDMETRLRLIQEVAIGVIVSVSVARRDFGGGIPFIGGGNAD